MRKSYIFIASLFVLCSKALVSGISLTSRRWPSCGNMGGKIYCYGGVTSVVESETVENTLYSLDITQFSGQLLESINKKWEIVQPNTPFYTESRRIPNAIVLADGKRLLIQGGYSKDKKYVNQTIVYDSTTNSWQSALPYTEGNRGERQIYAGSAVNLPNNLVGFYGGYEQFANTAIPRVTASGANMSYWPENGTSVGYIGLQMYSPEATSWVSFNPQMNLPVDYYPDKQSATLDPVSGKVYFLGGMYYTPTRDEILVPFDWVLIFNTKSGTWLNETLAGEVKPSKRQFHTANLLPNSRDIIVYGGTSGNDQKSLATLDYCFTLNLENNIWTEQVSVNVPPLLSGPRYAHSSVLVNTTLFILYGKGSDGTLQQPLITIDVSNVSNISYTPTFGAAIDAASPETKEYKKDNTPGLSKGAIGGIAAGASVALLAIAFGIICLVRRNRKSKQENAEEHQNKPTAENIHVDWDKIDSEYREVSPIGWSVTNSPHSANSLDLNSRGSLSVDVSTRGSFSPGITSTLDTANISVVKPSIDIADMRHTVNKPDAF